MNPRDASTNIVLLSDGTGNSSAKLMKTNVWRMYEALDLSSGDQIAMYDNGVGTSSFRIFAVLGGGLGWGLKRNVRDLYMFACRNYRPEGEGRDADRIYAFGFSRGAFTIRVLIGLIEDQGLITGVRGAELERQAKWAYRAYRRKFNATKGLVTPLRRLRDLALRALERMQGVPAYDQTKNQPARVAFMGLWDTVDAYGLPIDEMTRGWDQWVWPLSMLERTRPKIVEKVCHAMALDDERQTFHPVLMDESQEPTASHTSDEALSQVWFAGMHSNVGGGYPDDSLAYVPLRWMADAAARRGLRLHKHATEEWASRADPHGPIYDSRSGLGSYYRYEPRSIKKLTADRFADISIDRPKIHESVFKRIAAGRKDYAPIVLPERYAIVTEGGTLLEKTTNPYEHPTQSRSRCADQERVWNLVWLRRIVYFSTVGLSFLLIVPPFIFGTDGGGMLDQESRAISGVIELLGQFLPATLQTWTTYYQRYPFQLVIGAGILAALLLVSSRLQRSIGDNMRLLWDSTLAQGPRTVTPSAGPSDVIYRIRSHPLYRGTSEIVSQHIFPFVFGFGALLAAVMIVVGTANRAAFAIASASGTACPDVAERPAERRDTWVVAAFPSAELCYSTGIPIERGRTYSVRVDLPAGGWFDKNEPVTTAAGYASGNRALVFIPALPFRRVLTAQWFVPMARIGSKGAEYHTLSEVTTEFTPRRSGQLFLFVNDAIGLWPYWRYFYENNRGAATVTVTRLGRNPG